MSLSEGSLVGSLNGTTATSLLTATVKTVVRNFTVYNKDTAAATVTISIAGSDYCKVTLAAGDKLVCDEHIVLYTTQSIDAVLSGAITTTNPTYSITYAEVG